MPKKVVKKTVKKIIKKGGSCGCGPNCACK